MADLFWRPQSLATRQLLAAGLGLVAFLALVGVALDRAFIHTAESNLKVRLESYALGYAAGTEFDVTGRLLPPPRAPDPRLDFDGIHALPESLLSARTGPDGSYRIDGLPREAMLLSWIDPGPAFDPVSEVIATTAAPIRDVDYRQPLRGGQRLPRP